MRIVVGLVGFLLLCGGCKGDDTGGNAGTGGSGGVGSLMSGGSGGTGGMGGVAGTTGGGAVPGCAVADTSAGGPALHAAALEALAAAPPASACGFSACHAMTPRAMLMLLGATNLNTLLVGKASCEAPSIPLIDGAGGDAGLNHSWLWIKLTAPADDSTNVITDPSWGTPGNCGQATPGTFGQRMPQSFTNDMFLSEAALVKIRNWICGGAPGPM